MEKIELSNVMSNGTPIKRKKSGMKPSDLFNPAGRFSRSEFIVASLSPVILALPVVLLGLLFGLTGFDKTGIIMLSLLCVLGGISGYVQIVALIKRLHDMGNSGWWATLLIVLIFFGIGLIGLIPLLVFPGQPKGQTRWG